MGNCENALSTKTDTKTVKAAVSNEGRFQSIEERFLAPDYEIKKPNNEYKVISTETKNYIGEDGEEVEEITEVSTDGKMERTTITTHSELDGKKSTKTSI